MSLFHDDASCGIATEAAGDEFYTPPEVLERLPPIALDPCWSPASLVKAAKTYNIRRGQDGLVLDWKIDPADGIVFANPPFSATADWLHCAVIESNRWQVVVAMLVPAYAGDGPWGALVWPHASMVGFTKKRMQFIRPDGKRETKGRGHALILFGPDDACAAVAVHIGSELFAWVRVVGV